MKNSPKRKRSKSSKRRSSVNKLAKLTQVNMSFISLKSVCLLQRFDEKEKREIFQKGFNQFQIEFAPKDNPHKLRVLNMKKESLCEIYLGKLDYEVK